MGMNHIEIVINEPLRDAINGVLRRNANLTSVDVRNKLTEQGFDLTQEEVELACIEMESVEIAAGGVRMKEAVREAI